MANTTSEDDLRHYIQARYSVIYVVSQEEERIEEAIIRVSRTSRQHVMFWTCTLGFTFPDQDDGNHARRHAEVLAQVRDPATALEVVLRACGGPSSGGDFPDDLAQATTSMDAPTVFVFRDLHSFMDDPQLRRKIRDVSKALRCGPKKNVIVLSPVLTLPDEVSAEIPVVDFALPTKDDLRRCLDCILTSLPPAARKVITTEDAHLDAVADAALGLTYVQAQDVFALSLSRERQLDRNVISEAKRQIIRKSGTLEFLTPRDGVEDVGGLANLKTWLAQRAVGFTKRAAEYGIDRPRGVIMLGIPGCLSEGTRLFYRRGNRRAAGDRSLPIEVFYEKFNGIPSSSRPWTPGHQTFLQSWDCETGRVLYNAVRAVVDSGVKECIRLVTDRDSVDLTADHPVLTETGFVPAGDLVVGDTIRVRGSMKPVSSGRSDNAKNFNVEYTTPVKVASVVAVGPRRTFDIEMALPYSNFMVNGGIVVHNCGKSLVAKAVAKSWSMPLIRMDVGKVYGGFVGDSERNIRSALKTVESVAPCVLFLDEIEKGLSGSRSSGQTDGGTSARVLGTMLSWMQDREKPVFMVATANDVAALPPEMLRKGRWDEVFFVDLPSAGERRDIFRLHISKRKRDPETYDLSRLAEAADKFSGSEIEEAVKAAMFLGLTGDREFTTDDVLTAIRETIPLSTTMGEKIKGMREWAKTRARPASPFQDAGKRTPKKSLPEDKFRPIEMD